MRRLPLLLLTFALTSGSVFSLHAFADDASAPAPPSQEGENAPPPPPHKGPPGGVHILPPQVREKLNLTAEQQTQIEGLEKETTDKLNKILTPAQQKIVVETRPPRPRGGRGPGGGGPGGEPGAGGPGGGTNGPGDSTTPPPAPDGMGPPH